MKPDEAIRIFDNYRDYVNDGSKVTIHYDQVKTMVEAYGVLEKVIQDQKDTNKELLELNLDLNNLVVKHVLKNNKLKCCGNCDRRVKDHCDYRNLHLSFYDYICDGWGLKVKDEKSR